MEPVDVLVVGGGINGVGIARDAAGRGLSVVLVEQEDLGSATSSASSKLIHGGLRYLEQLEFRLVAEALAERETLLRIAPHLVRPMRFVMPHAPGLRPRWMIRAGLFLYDVLAHRDTLPASAAVDLGPPLKPEYTRGFEYSDCAVDDARLVVANARAAADLGATIMTRTACVSAVRENGAWCARLNGVDGEGEIRARAIVNATGPWVERFLTEAAGETSPAHLKLVQGSHIVVPRLYEGDRAYILQNDDGRVVFVCPFEGSYSVVGTTDVELTGDPRACTATAEEIAYLCAAANRYFARAIAPSDAVWAYCGVRALVDGGEANPSKLTRDYLLHVGDAGGALPILSVFGGKITTYRKLAERVLEKLAPYFPGPKAPWTGRAPLPGGDGHAHLQALVRSHPALPEELLSALVRRHGSRAERVLEGVSSVEDLGERFGGDLYAVEVNYFIAHEWARSVEDVLWRRTKAGLDSDARQQARLREYLQHPVR